MSQVTACKQAKHLELFGAAQSLDEVLGRAKGLLRKIRNEVPSPSDKENDEPPERLPGLSEVLNLLPEMLDGFRVETTQVLDTIDELLF